MKTKRKKIIQIQQALHPDLRREETMKLKRTRMTWKMEKEEMKIKEALTGKKLMKVKNRPLNLDPLPVLVPDQDQGLNLDRQVVLNLVLALLALNRVLIQDLLQDPSLVHVQDPNLDQLQEVQVAVEVEVQVRVALKVMHLVQLPNQTTRNNQ